MASSIFSKFKDNGNVSLQNRKELKYTYRHTYIHIYNAKRVKRKEISPTSEFNIK